MGNDLDVCSKDKELEEYFEQEHGPASESVWQFITRSSDRLCTRVARPKRLDYSAFDLHQSRYCSPIFSFSPHVSWEESEFKFPAADRIMHACVWKIKVQRPGQAPNPPDSSIKPICILYLHTNMRSIVDALEVLPVAQVLGASVMAFDWAGCGKSTGHLHGRMDKDIEPLFDWMKALFGENVQVVLWARGMGTAAALALLARWSNPQPTKPQDPVDSQLKQPEKKSSFSIFRFGSSDKSPEKASASTAMGEGAMAAGPIKAVVLDSPFTTIQDLVKAAIERMHGKGFTITKTIVQWGAKRMLQQLSQKLGGLDLFSIRPINFASRIRVPAFIINADHDDYIPADHGACFARQWGGPVQCATFAGQHFGPRSADVVLSVVGFISAFLDIDPQATPPGPVTTLLMQANTVIRSVDVNTVVVGVDESKEEEEMGIVEPTTEGDSLQFIDLEEVRPSKVEGEEVFDVNFEAVCEEIAAIPDGLPPNASLPSLAIASQPPPPRNHSLSSLAMRGLG